MVESLEQNFFGRKSILELIRRRVIDLKEGYRQNIALLGYRTLGKTSIFRHFLANLDDESIVEIYLDLEETDFDYLVFKFAGSLLYNFSRQKKLSPHEDLDILLENTRRFLPQTVQALKKIQTLSQKGKRAEAYQDLISLPEIFTLESGKFCVIILDEFQALETIGVPNAFQELGKKIMTQRRCLYLVASSAITEARKILSEKLSLLFGNFELVEVAAFDLKTGQEFLSYQLGNVQMSPALRHFLIDFTAGHPFYLNLLVQEILCLSVVHNQKEVFFPLLAQAVENMIFNRWGILGRHFEHLMQDLCQIKSERLIASILIALANGKYKLKEILEEAGGHRSGLSQKIGRLIDEGLIAKNGNYYCFQDKLLRFWIKYVYQRRIRSISENLVWQKELFRRELKECFDSFQRTAQKDLSTRIMDLLQCFDNEALQLNGRRYKLPAFREITQLKLSGREDWRFDVIKAASVEETWFIIFKEDSLLEGEVNAFLTETRKLKERPDRSLIISLGDMDVNARLKALQEKFWIWNEKELNDLLNLFDKPYIVK